MQRIVIISVFLVALSFLAGCTGTDTGRGQLIPYRSDIYTAPPAGSNIAGAREVDLVEQVAVDRRSYRNSLQVLVRYYTTTGNNMKLNWAKKELEALDSMPKYRYIIDAEVSNLRATTPIPEADSIFTEAIELQKRAEQIPLFKDDDTLRLALEKYNQVIRDYPSSDKIDDAAYKAAGIYEHFRDYSIALLYYQRSYEWDPETLYPARFRAAYILDKQMKRKAEALELYQQAVKRESRYKEWTEFGEKRILELTNTSEGNLPR